MKQLLVLILLFLITGYSSAQKVVPPYKNSSLPVEERVKDLLSRMTLEEKFWQLFMIPGDLENGKEKYYNGIFGFQISASGKSADAAAQLLNYSGGGSAVETAEKINKIQRYFIEESRLGIPIIAFDEALHGLVRDGATAFPQSIALAATWDTALMHRVSSAIARECKSRGIRQILSPVVNIASDVRWGRTEETYGEDPFLTSEIGVAFVSEFEKLGVITTPKHFIANVGDGGRDSYPIHFNERLLREIYLPPFKACFTRGGSLSVMTSYNSLDGSPCTGNNWLLNNYLKKELGFKGFVISDAGATGGANVLHFTAKDYAESTVNSINGGLDVIFQTSYDHYKLFIKGFEDGKIPMSVIDEAVARVLRAKFNLGLFEHPYIDPAEAKIWNGNPDHRKISREAAEKSFVLLKNDNNVLPLKKSIKHIAVIGSDAIESRLGGYCGPGINKVNILDGIKNRADKDVKVDFSKGCDRTQVEVEPVPSSCFTHLEGGVKKPGLLGEYYNNIDMSGIPSLVRTDSQIQFGWTLFSPDQEKINYDYYSVKWTGTIKAPSTGTFKLGVEGNDGYRIYIDNKLVLDNWKKQTFQRKLTSIVFEKGKEYAFKMEYFEPTGNARVKLVWNIGISEGWKKEMDDAVKVASASDLAIVVVGINEGEFNDRALLNLPGRQETLISKIAATGKPVVVLLSGGSAITMNNWLDKVNGVMDIWYPGEDGGDAVAAVLFGDRSPAGRLPITFPVSEGQLPLVYNHKPTGRGDDYTDLTGQPLFPFGFGLSYTTFEYSNLSFEKKQIGASESAIVHFNVKNTGKCEGDEVVQLYIRDEYSSVARPLQELKGFQRVHLKAGESAHLSFKITPDLLTMLDINLKEVVEPGDFRIMIGGSSKDIKLRGILNVK
jgi:beta-glucosidase